MSRAGGALRGILLSAGLLGLASSGAAQPLDQEIERLLGNDCEQLGVMNGNPPGGPDVLGPNLDAICQASLPGNPVGSAAGGGAAPAPGSDAALARQRADERLEQERGAGPETDADDAPDFARRFSVDSLGLWISGDAEDRNRDVTRFEDGYESTLSSATAGVDYAFSDLLFVGLGVEYQQVDGDFDAGGDFDTESLGGVLYGSLSPLPGAYLDVVVGYAERDYEVDRSVSFEERVDNQIDGRELIDTSVSGIAAGDTDGDEVRAGAQLGYEHSWNGLGLAPRAGVDFVRTRIDDFAERGSTGLELAYDDRTRQSLQSSFGIDASLTASSPLGVIVPVASFEWVHEFQDDQRSTKVRFVEDLRADPLVFRFQNEKPDRDFFRLAGGATLVLPRGIQLFAVARTLLGHDHFDGYGVSAGVRVPMRLR